jgi:hypothetical protein
MSVSAILGTVIGLVFVFALAALFCSAVIESISNLLQKRAKYLLTGLRAMLDEESKIPAELEPSSAPSGEELHDLTRGVVSKEEQRAAEQNTVSAGEQPTALTRIKETISATGEKSAKPGDLTQALYMHPLISSLQTQRVLLLPRILGKLRMIRNPQRVIRNPQYMPPKLFAQALIDTLLPDTTGSQASRSVLRQLEKSVERLPDTFPARQSIKTLLAQADDNLSAFQRSLEEWYDAQMGRVSGWYKRWTKVILGIAGLLLAISVNVDAVRIAHTLYVDEPVRQAVVAQATADPECIAEDPAEQRQCVEDLAASLEQSGLPIWYPEGCAISELSHCWKWADNDNPDGRMFLVKVLGWLVVAFAVSFGAPFWFDALSKLGSLRTSGPKPDS